MKSKIEGEGKAIEKIKQLAGSAFSKLFVPAITFKPIEDFREGARAILTKGDANKLIKLCQTESAPLPLRARLVAVSARGETANRRLRHEPQRRLEDRSTPLLRGRQDAALPRRGAESPRQDRFPARTGGNRLHEFMEKLETTRF